MARIGAIVAATALVGATLLSVEDWTPEWKVCTNKLGMSYAFRATKVLTDAGYVDTYRAANPDVCRHEGRTWSPHPPARLITPNRIDFVFAKGDVTIDAPSSSTSASATTARASSTPTTRPW
jgi:hypothetical protein